MTKPMGDRWFLSDCEGQLVIVREDKLRNVSRNERGEITGYSLPAEWGPDVVIAEWDLGTWDAGDDETDDLRREIAARIVAEHNEVARLRAERSEIRAALIRELRESHRRRLAWKSARRGRARAREEVRLLHRDALRDRLAVNGAIDRIERLAGERDQAEADVERAQAERDRLAEQRQDAIALAAEAYTDAGADVQSGGTWPEDGPSVDAHDLLEALDALNGEDGPASEPIETRVHAAFADSDVEGVDLNAMTVAELTDFVMAAIRGKGGRS